MNTQDIILYDRDIQEPLFDYLEERFGKNVLLTAKTPDVSGII